MVVTRRYESWPSCGLPLPKGRQQNLSSAVPYKGADNVSVHIRSFREQMSSLMLCSTIVNSNHSYNVTPKTCSKSQDPHSYAIANFYP